MFHFSCVRNFPMLMPRVDEENARDVPPVEPMAREQAVTDN